MKPKYCDFCSKKLQILPNGKFDINTGKPTFKYRCSVNNCNHYGVPHKLGKYNVFGLSNNQNCKDCDGTFGPL